MFNLPRYARLGEMPQWKELQLLQQERREEADRLWSELDPLVAFYTFKVSSERLRRIEARITELNSEIHLGLLTGTMKVKPSDAVPTTVIPPHFFFWD